MLDWHTSQLGDIADIRVSNVDKKSVAGERPVRLCNYMDVYENAYIDAGLPFMEATASPSEIERFKLQEGDVLITKDSETPDDIGIPAVISEDVQNLVCGYHLALIRPQRDKVDPVYLSKQLSSVAAVSHFSRRASGSTRYGLSISVIASMPIQLASMQEQRRIAEILSTLDSAIEQTETLIAKHRQMKAGLMHDLFSRGVLPNGNMRTTINENPHAYKRTTYGWIPKEWAAGRLIEYLTAKPKNGYSPPEVSDGATYKALGLGCLTHDGFMPVQIKRVAGDSLACKLATLTHGDLLLSRSNTPDLVGLCGIYRDIGEKCIYPDLMMRIVPNQFVLPDFMEAVLQSASVRRQIKVVATGTSGSMVKLNNATVSDLQIVIPDLDEQERIITRIQSYSRYLGIFISDLEKLTNMKCGLAGDLLTAKLSVSPGKF